VSYSNEYKQSDSDNHGKLDNYHNYNDNTGNYNKPKAIWEKGKSLLVFIRQMAQQFAIGSYGWGFNPPNLPFPWASGTPPNKMCRWTPKLTQVYLLNSIYIRRTI